VPKLKEKTNIANTIGATVGYEAQLRQAADLLPGGNSTPTPISAVVGRRSLTVRARNRVTIKEGELR